MNFPADSGRRLFENLRPYCHAVYRRTCGEYDWVVFFFRSSRSITPRKADF